MCPQSTDFFYRAKAVLEKLTPQSTLVLCECAAVPEWSRQFRTTLCYRRLPLKLLLRSDPTLSFFTPLVTYPSLLQCNTLNYYCSCGIVVFNKLQTFEICPGVIP